MGVQSMPKAAYYSGCRKKHNCLWLDLVVGTLTPQSGVLPLDHCDQQPFCSCAADIDAL